MVIFDFHIQTLDDFDREHIFSVGKYLLYIFSKQDPRRDLFEDPFKFRLDKNIFVF